MVVNIVCQNTTLGLSYLFVGTVGLEKGVLIRPTSIQHKLKKNQVCMLLRLATEISFSSEQSTKPVVMGLRS